MFQILGQNPSPEKRRIFHSLLLPGILIWLMFAVRLMEDLEGWNLVFLGVKPLTVEGLPGIVLSPFIHSNWLHFFNNAVSFFILATTLFYFYQEIAYKVFFTIYFLAGAWLWFGGREAWHVGASGWVYGLTAFLFVSGLIRKHIPLLAVALFVVFLYGSLVWGMFPLAENLPHSWEGHLWGFLAGLVAAVIYRNQGPQKPEPPEEDLSDEEEEDEEEAYWNTTTT